MTIVISLLFALLGALVYVLSQNPKFQELGRIAFGCGLLAFLLQGSSKVVELLTPR